MSRIPPGPGTARPARLARNVASTWLALGLEVAVTFFLSPFVIHSLGGTAFGVWVLVASLTGYLGFLDLGVRNAVTRFVSKFHAQGDHAAASATVSAALGMFVLAGIVAIALSVVISTVLLPWFHIPPLLIRDAQIALILAGFNVSGWLVNGVFSGVIVGLQRLDVLNYVAVLVGLGRAAAVVIALNADTGLIGLAAVELGAVLARCLANTWLAHRLYAELRVRLRVGLISHVGMILSFSLFSLFLDVANDLVYFSDAVVIGAVLPVAMLTFFSIAASMRNYARGLVAGMANVFIPAASAHDSAGSHSALQHLVLSGIRSASLVVFPMALTFMLRGGGFIDLWIGDEYAELSGEVLWVLSLALLFGGASQVSQSIVLGIGRHHGVVPVVLGEGLVSLVLSIALIRPLGIVGVAWGTVVPSIVVSLLFWPAYMRRTVGVSVRDYVIAAWARPGLSVLPFALLSYAVERAWPAANLVIFFIQVGLTLPVALVGFWYGCLSRKERLDARGRLRARLAAAGFCFRGLTAERKVSMDGPPASERRGSNDRRLPLETEAEHGETS